MDEITKLSNAIISVVDKDSFDEVFNHERKVIKRMYNYDDKYCYLLSYEYDDDDNLLEWHAKVFKPLNINPKDIDVRNWFDEDYLEKFEYILTFTSGFIPQSNRKAFVVWGDLCTTLDTRNLFLIASENMEIESSNFEVLEVIDAINKRSFDGILDIAYKGINKYNEIVVNKRAFLGKKIL